MTEEELAELLYAIMFASDQEWFRVASRLWFQGYTIESVHDCHYLTPRGLDVSDLVITGTVTV